MVYRSRSNHPPGFRHHVSNVMQTLVQQSYFTKLHMWFCYINWNTKNNQLNLFTIKTLISSHNLLRNPYLLSLQSATLYDLYYL